ncbi:adenosylcobinamide-GDP ribazoletransferase [Halanaerobiaceae bacterium Z-7014]|uniref:Adenosylcobinamide-GDP ribazoletransferase n=1 Tax=Halonatronomonas betaini TaxID=2778430 RepID=A0A931AS42_9FIRM|nr:adenosylcobinamide-GDP ribazoletransferase [Halonatronomonas betaini]MBF8437462.1 adenosylcobinamide-GDP ribazoletransferase [Halonatronomonas betaini]
MKSLNQELQGVFFAITFLTRIPVPFKINYHNRLPSISIKYFTFIGLILGLILAIIYRLFSLFWPPILIAPILLGFYIYLTGAIHLDGLLDSVDGLFSNRSKQEILEIMKDSLNGSFATVTAVIYLLVKFILFYKLQETNFISTLIIFPVLSRWLVIFAIKFFPRAEKSSLGEGFDYKIANKDFLISSILPALIILIYLFYDIISLGLAISLIIIPVLITIYIASYTINKIDGLTGDIYGMINEIGEIIILLTILTIYYT